MGHVAADSSGSGDVFFSRRASRPFVGANGSAERVGSGFSAIIRGGRTQRFFERG
jgi:hypothetical protein